MNSVLDKLIVLQLNAVWQCIKTKTVRRALTDMCGDKDQPPALALDITLDSEGNLVDAIPTTMADWLKLPVRDSDLFVMTGKGPIRCPTVIICPQYKKMPVLSTKFSPDAVRMRDNDTCQLTGRKLRRGEGNMGHIIARTRGGPDSFENVVYMTRELNTKMGTRTPEEMGYRLLRKPFTPPPMPASAFIKKANHPHWAPFILKNA